MGGMRVREVGRALAGVVVPLRDPAEGTLGTVVTAGLMAAYADPPVHMDEVVTAVLATVGVYWLAHVYAETVGRTPEGGGPAFSRARLRRSLRANWGLVRAALPLLAVAVVVWAAGADPTTALGAGVWCAVVVLVVEAVVTARRYGVRGPRLLIAAAAAGFIGLILVALKSGVD
jgi:hypothetical protein